MKQNRPTFTPPNIPLHRSTFLATLVLYLLLVPPLGSETWYLGQGPHYPGSLIPILYLPDEPISGFTAELQPPKGRPITARGFKYPSDGNLQMVLLGINSLSTPGSYQIKVKWWVGASEQIQEKQWEVMVIQKEFKSETIALNPSNTAIRTAPDPKKTEQLRVMTKILTNFDPLGTLDWRPLHVPMASPRLTSWFGDRRIYSYSNGTSSATDHKGIDYGAKRGTEVQSATDGTVVFAGMRITTGNTIVVQFGPGLYALYYHLDTIAVVVGGQVKKAMALGTVGSTGLATGPHLHFEIQNQGVAVDPNPLFSQGILDIPAVLALLSQD